MASRYSVEASEMPARSAPISDEKPNISLSEVLNDKEAVSDPAVQGVDFIFVGQQLYNDNGA